MRGLWYRFGVYDQIDLWIQAHPNLRTALVLSVVFVGAEFVRRMKARDMKLLADRRAADQRRADERTAAIAERVSKLGGPGGTAQ